MKFRVGRKDGLTVTPAFDLEQLDGGGIRFTNIRQLTDAERHQVMAHFGRVFRGKFQVAGGQHFRTLEPGTVMHFEHAAYQLPNPFQLLPKG